MAARLITMQKLFTEAADGVPDHKDSSLIVRTEWENTGGGGRATKGLGVVLSENFEI